MQKYSNLQIWLHWIVFILILGQFVFHEPISEAFELRLEGQEVVPSALIGLHLVFGGVVFLLIVTRLWVRMGQGVPSYPKENAALGGIFFGVGWNPLCLLYTSPSPRDATLSRMPSSA